MIKKILLTILFILQILVPLSMIGQKEYILRKGTSVKFQVEPFDPYDAFRGKYLRIALTENMVEKSGTEFREDQTAYVLLMPDNRGFAALSEISPTPFRQGIYMKCSIDRSDSGNVWIDPPFNRFYLNEEYSEKAETLYNELSRGEPEDAYITVRIIKGRAVVEDMFLGGTPIYDYIDSAD